MKIGRFCTDLALPRPLANIHQYGPRARLVRGYYSPPFRWTTVKYFSDLHLTCSRFLGDFFGCLTGLTYFFSPLVFSQVFSLRGSAFSTKDCDNDGYSGNYAVDFKSAWWYKSCYYSNLDGLWLEEFVQLCWNALIQQEKRWLVSWEIRDEDRRSSSEWLLGITVKFFIFQWIGNIFRGIEIKKSIQNWFCCSFLLLVLCF